MNYNYNPSWELFRLFVCFYLVRYKSIFIKKREEEKSQWREEG